MGKQIITVNEARKILGKMAVNKTEEEIMEEIEIANFLSDIVLNEYKQKDKYN